MAVRYSDQKKQQVVEYVIAYDKENGSGGEAAAKRKFGINPISIRKWCVESSINQTPEAEPPPKIKGSVSLKPGRGK